MQAEKDKVCNAISLTYKQRMYGFFICFLGGVTLAVIVRAAAKGSVP